jgi:hypothetical protein
LNILFRILLCLQYSMNLTLLLNFQIKEICTGVQYTLAKHLCERIQRGIEYTERWVRDYSNMIKFWTVNIRCKMFHSSLRQTSWLSNSI